MLESIEDSLFWTALELYVESFPRSEREPLAEVAEVGRGRSEFGSVTRRFAVAEVDGRLGGLLYFASHADSGLGFFIYIVVEESLRKSGIGQQLLEFGIEQCRSDVSELKAVLFECERPELAEGDERAFRERRLAYFAKRGAVLVTPTYVQPILGEGREEVPLFLMAQPLADAIDWSSAVANFYRAFFQLSPDSPSERAAIAGIVAT